MCEGNKTVFHINPQFVETFILVRFTQEAGSTVHHDLSGTCGGSGSEC